MPDVVAVKMPPPRTTDTPNTVQIPPVDAPRFDGESHRMTGVLLATGDDQQFVGADLVVDATGRGTRLPAWPAEESVRLGICYATAQLRIPDGLINEKVVVAGASRTDPVGLGSFSPLPGQSVAPLRQAARWGTTCGCGGLRSAASDTAGHTPTVTLNSLVGSRASNRIGPSSAATQAADPRSTRTSPDLARTTADPSVHSRICGPS